MTVLFESAAHAHAVSAAGAVETLTATSTGATPPLRQRPAARHHFAPSSSTGNGASGTPAPSPRFFPGGASSSASAASSLGGGGGGGGGAAKRLFGPDTAPAGAPTLVATRAPPDEPARWFVRRQLVVPPAAARRAFLRCRATGAPRVRRADIRYVYHGLKVIVEMTVWQDVRIGRRNH